MKIEKIHLDDIVRCYCVSAMEVDGELNVFMASENPTSECNAYSKEGFKTKEKVWDDRGGCMSIIPIPHRQNEFLAVNEFYLKVSPSLSKLVWGKHTADGWQIKDVTSLPYLHRFDIYDVNGQNYVIAATIAKEKKDKLDWSKPGQVYVAKLPDDPTEGLDFKLILDGCYRNHGYCQGKTKDGLVCGYFASDSGIYRITPPYKTADWQVEHILSGNISEVAVNDLDQDGIDEIMTIEPFHGNTIKVYRLIDGAYQPVWQYANEIDFAHSLVAGKLNSENVFVAGIRRLDCELFALTYADGEYKVTVIDQGGGPANLAIIHDHHQDYIAAANHTANQACLYKIDK